MLVEIAKQFTVFSMSYAPRIHCVQCWTSDIQGGILVFPGDNAHVVAYNCLQRQMLHARTITHSLVKADSSETPLPSGAKPFLCTSQTESRYE